MEDEESASVLGDADAVFVFEAGVPKRLYFSLFPCFSIFGDFWIIFFKGGIVLVKR